MAPQTEATFRSVRISQSELDHCFITHADLTYLNSGDDSVSVSCDETRAELNVTGMSTFLDLTCKGDFDNLLVIQTSKFPLNGSTT